MADVAQRDTPPKAQPLSDLPPSAPPVQPAQPPSPPRQSSVLPLEPLSAPPAPPPMATVRVEDVIAAAVPSHKPQPPVPPTEPSERRPERSFEKSPVHTAIANADFNPQSAGNPGTKAAAEQRPSPKTEPKVNPISNPQLTSRVKLEVGVEDRTPSKHIAVEDRTPSKSEPSPVKSNSPRPTPPTPSSQKRKREDTSPPPPATRHAPSREPQSNPPPVDQQQQQQRQYPQQHHQRPPPAWQTAPRSAHPSRRGAPPPGPSQPPFNTGPIPRNLPKNAKNRPKNARVFVGNLASEFTDVHEMIRIFYRYGDLIEEPVLRRSFGFIQYAAAESASRAVVAEQGRIIGGIPIDLSIADNREVKRGTHVVNNTPFPHGPKQKLAAGAVRGARPRDPAMAPGGVVPPARKRRRSLSPGAPPRRVGVVNPPTYHRMRPEPRTGFHLRILCMSPTARVYAKRCEQMFKSEVGLGVEILQIIASLLGDALAKAMRDSIPYVMVVASKDVEDGTCTIRTLERTGYEKAGRGNGIISLREAIDVCLIDRGMRPSRAANAPLPAPQQFQPAPPIPLAQAGWTQPAPMGAAARPLPLARKPGWMTGARAPAHPQQQHLLRQGHPSQAALPSHMPGVPPPHQAYPPQHQQQMPPHQMGHMQSAPASRGQYDRQPPYGAMPPQQVAEYGAPPTQVGWNSGVQQPPMHGYGQPPVAQQDYGRGGYGAPPQGSMPARNGPGPNARDEYDPAAVIPGANRPQEGGYDAWNGAQQDPAYNRHNPQYPVGRPGPGPAPGMRGREQAPPAYGMGPPQGGYNQNMGAPYSSVPGNDQGYAQRPGGYGAPPTAGPPGGRYGGAPAAGYDNRGSWGPSNGMPYDNRMQQHQQSPGMPADGRSNHPQAYGNNGGAPMPRRDGAGYVDQHNGHGAQGAEWGGRRANGPQNDAAARRDNGNNGAAGTGYNTGPHGGQGGQNGRAGMNGGGNSAGGGPVPAAGGVDIGKLTNLISAFQQQQNMQQGSAPTSRGGDGARNAGPPLSSAPRAGHAANAPPSSASLLTVQGVPPRQQNGGHAQHAQHAQQYMGQYGAPPQQQHGMYQQQPPPPPQQQQQRNYYGR